MAPNILLHEDASFSISRGSVQLTLGGASVTVDAKNLGELIRALEGIRFIVDGTAPGRTASDQRVEGDASMAARESRAEPVATAAPARGSALRAPSPAAAAPTTSRATTGPLLQPPTNLVDAPLPPRKKRRSRKRVGDALEQWMGKNPGWHTESDLLKAVIDNQMTDADPKRALKIALGKQQNDRFIQDANGAWKLVGDDTPTSPPMRSGRKSARTPTPTRVPVSRAGAPKRLKTKLGRDTASATPKAEDDTESDPDASSKRTVLIKPGQDRKSASLPPGELEARQAAADAVESRRPARWSKVKFNPNDLERARKNLFGLEAGSKTPGSGT